MTNLPYPPMPYSSGVDQPFDPPRMTGDPAPFQAIPGGVAPGGVARKPDGLKIAIVVLLSIVTVLLGVLVLLTAIQVAVQDSFVGSLDDPSMMESEDDFADYQSAHLTILTGPEVAKAAPGRQAYLLTNEGPFDLDIVKIESGGLPVCSGHSDIFRLPVGESTPVLLEPERELTEDTGLSIITPEETILAWYFPEDPPTDAREFLDQLTQTAQACTKTS